MSLALEEGNYTTVMTNGRSSLFILGNVYYLSCARLRELNWPEFDKYTRGGERGDFSLRIGKSCQGQDGLSPRLSP